MRMALGAGRLRLVRQLLTESSLLGLFGGIAGLLTASLTLALLNDQLRHHIPRVTHLSLDLPVFGYAAAIALLSGLVFGTLPALRATAVDQEVALAQGISVGVVFAVAWGMAGGLAAVAGMFVGTSFAGVSAGSAFVALKALPAIVVGGIDSLTGAVVGSLIVGLSEAYVATYQTDIEGLFWDGFTFYGLLFLFGHSTRIPIRNNSTEEKETEEKSNSKM